MVRKRRPAPATVAVFLRDVALLRWQWTLANRGVVTAVIDPEALREMVSQDDRILSDGPRGSRPDGHAVSIAPASVAGRSDRPPIDAVVSFDPQLAICILRVDGQEVAPTTWPIRERKIEVQPSPRPWGRIIGFGALLAGALTLLVFRLTAPAPPPKQDRSLHGTQRAMNGLFIAHFRPDLEAKPAVMPNGVSGLLLEDKEQRLAIVLAAVPSEGAVPHEPWALQQKLRDEALANVPKGIARFEEAARRDETCLGERGAVVTGYLAHKTSRRARVWSCAFVHDGAGYLALHVLNEPVDEATERSARTIVESTELTRLADLGAMPDPSSLPPLPAP